MTNYDNIMSQITPEIMAGIISDYFWGECTPNCPVITSCMKEYTCDQNIRKWLNQEVKEGEKDNGVS